MYKTHLSKTRIFLLLVSLIIISGCAKNEAKLQVEPTAVPEITAAYLLEHRIISYQPRYQEKIVTTLPYEIKTFDENYLIFLVAHLPYANNTALLKAAQPRYYIWLERRADNWRDFIAVYSQQLAPLKINSHYSAIRQGHFYKEYTIDFTLEQLSYVQDSGLDLLLVNQQNLVSEIDIPSLYIKAYLEMIAQASQ